MIDPLLQELIAAVRAHYDDGDAPPLLLSSFGHANKELLVKLKGRYGNLLAAVKAAGDENLRLVDERIGRQCMAPADVASRVEVAIRERLATQKEGSASFDGLPKVVQIAFCVRVEAGEAVAIRVTPPFEYTKVGSTEIIRPGFRHIPDEYRKPGLVLKAASLQDREALWRSFMAWTEKEQLDPASFREPHRTNALSRLLAAQPPDITRRMVIPADIAEILLRSR